MSFFKLLSEYAVMLPLDVIAPVDVMPPVPAVNLSASIVPVARTLPQFTRPVPTETEVQVTPPAVEKLVADTEPEQVPPLSARAPTWPHCD